MHLYLDPQDRYLAVPAPLRFTPVNGFREKFPGQDVPRVICDAFIRQYGGRYLELSE